MARDDVRSHGPAPHRRTRIKRRSHHADAGIGTGALIGDEVLSCGDLVVDVAAHQAFAGGAPLDLSHLQFVVLAHLVHQAGRVVSTLELIAAASDVVPPTSRTIASAVSRLRSRLGTGAGRPVITVSRARGYRLTAPN